MASSARILARAGQLRLSPGASVVARSSRATAADLSSFARGPAALAAHSQPRRNYASESPSSSAPPKKKPGKIRTTFKWTRRAVYLSVLLMAGGVLYDGYLDRHPAEQVTPDPKKKTVVVLGK